MPLLAFLFALWFGSSPLAAAEPGAIESDLVITVQGKEQHVSLNQALSLLDITSASIALIDEGRIAFARAYGKDATPDTLYQAASLSKFVAAIGAMRLVESGTLALSDVWQGFTSIFIHRDTLREVLTRQNGGPYGLGAAVAGDGASLVLMKRGQNVGYQGHLILYPASEQGMVVMTNSDNASKLATALIKRAAEACGWSELSPLAD
ncbi:MAG TPA: serine hydrolase domain-containing protein [Methyloceanibacter sp.]|nr:serine hydrolase domain-containing protein [Methyloceanibacter sp.]